MSVLLAARGPKEKEIRDAWVIEDRQRRLMYDSSERLERKKTRSCCFLISAIWLKGAQVMVSCFWMLRGVIASLHLIVAIWINRLWIEMIIECCLKTLNASPRGRRYPCLHYDGGSVCAKKLRNGLGDKDKAREQLANKRGRPPWG